MARLVHLEMPSSPHMYLIDVAEVRRIVGPDVIITLDGSFSPPNFDALQSGWTWPCSARRSTWAARGHRVRILSGRRDLIEQIRSYRDTTGPVANGNAAFLLRRSLYTLPLRMERVNALGMTVRGT